MWLSRDTRPLILARIRPQVTGSVAACFSPYPHIPNLFQSGMGVISTFHLRAYIDWIRHVRCLWLRRALGLASEGSFLGTLEVGSHDMSKGIDSFQWLPISEDAEKQSQDKRCSHSQGTHRVVIDVISNGIIVANTIRVGSVPVYSNCSQSSPKWSLPLAVKNLSSSSLTYILYSHMKTCSVDQVVSVKRW